MCARESVKIRKQHKVIASLRFTFIYVYIDVCVRN